MTHVVKSPPRYDLFRDKAVTGRRGKEYALESKYNLSCVRLLYYCLCVHVFKHEGKRI